MLFRITTLLLAMLLLQACGTLPISESGDQENLNTINKALSESEGYAFSLGPSGSEVTYDISPNNNGDAGFMIYVNEASAGSSFLYLHFDNTCGIMQKLHARSVRKEVYASQYRDTFSSHTDSTTLKIKSLGKLDSEWHYQISSDRESMVLKLDRKIKRLHLVEMVGDVNILNIRSL